MKKTYFVIPNTSIWNDGAVVASIGKVYTSKSEAIEVAKAYSRQYNSDFIVCSMETKVSTISSLIDFE